MRALLLLVLLAGCAVAPPKFPDCPGRIPVPPGKKPAETVGSLEIRVALWGEAERRRGDACAAASDARDAWIRGQL